MTDFDRTQVSEFARSTTNGIETSTNLSKEVIGLQEASANKRPLEKIDLGTGDTLSEDRVMQALQMKNGDRLMVERQGGKICALIDKNGREIAVPGESKNIAPADAPTEMYRLSNGALYIKDKKTGDQELVNTDGSRIQLDNKGIKTITRGNICIGFARTHEAFDHLEIKSPYSQ